MSLQVASHELSAQITRDETNLRQLEDAVLQAEAEALQLQNDLCSRHLLLTENSAILRQSLADLLAAEAEAAAAQRKSVARHRDTLQQHASAQSDLNDRHQRLRGTVDATKAEAASDALRCTHQLEALREKEAALLGQRAALEERERGLAGQVGDVRRHHQRFHAAESALLERLRQELGDREALLSGL